MMMLNNIFILNLNIIIHTLSNYVPNTAGHNSAVLKLD